ncbi:MAG: ABC transporter substrate-binding protein [Nitrospinota bacterium]
MKKLLTPVFVTGLLALAVLIGPMAGQALAAEKVTFVMSWIPDARWASEMVAKYRGYFQAEGLEVTLKWAKGGRNAAKQTATGAAHLGAVAGSDILPSRLKGIPLISIASTLSKTGTSFISLPKAGIRTPKDFIGKKVGVQRGSTTWVGLLALLNRYGMNIDQLNKIEVGFGLKPLLAGVVDVRPAMYYNEVVLARHKGIALNVIWIPEHGVDLVGTGIATTEKYLKANPKVVQGYIRAVLKGYEHAKRDPEDAIKALLQYKPEHDAAYQRKVLKVLHTKISVPAKNGLYGWHDPTEWNNTQENLVKFGVMKKRTDLSKAYTNQFVEEFYGKK